MSTGDPEEPGDHDGAGWSEWDWSQGPPPVVHDWQHATKASWEQVTQGFDASPPPSPPQQPTPQQPPTPMQGHAAPAKKPRRSKAVVFGVGIGGGVVALGLVLVIVAVVVKVVEGDASAWRVSAPPPGGGKSELHSTFLANGDRVVVRVSESGVGAYDARNGAKWWRREVPNGHKVWAASRGATQHVMAYVHANDDQRMTIDAVDVLSGEQLWSQRLDTGSFLPTRELEDVAVTAAKGRVFVSTGAKVVGYDAKQGPHAPRSSAPVTRKLPEGCNADDILAEGDDVTMLGGCVETDEHDGGKRLYRLDPDTLAGKPASIPEGEDDHGPTLVHASPPVVREMGEGGTDELWVLDDDGKRLAKATGDGHGNNFDLSADLAVVGNTLVALTGSEFTTSEPIRAVGFDLRSGIRQWSVKVADSGMVSFVEEGGPADKATLLAGEFEEPEQLLTLDPGKQDKIRRGATYPPDAGGDFLVGEQLVSVHDDELVGYEPR